jgi:hypothetical protein
MQWLAIRLSLMRSAVCGIQIAEPFSRGWKPRGIERKQLQRRKRTMLETIAIILIVLWLLGMVSGYTMGAFIHVLLVIAIVLFLVRLVSGRRVV